MENRSMTTENRRPEMTALTFKVFLACNYARPDLPSRKSHGLKATTVALAALGDSRFPENPVGVDELIDFAYDTKIFHPYPAQAVRVLSKAFYEYRNWVAGLKDCIPKHVVE